MERAFNPVFVWDFTMSAEEKEPSDVISWLREIGKAWCFQLEKGEESGYLHYQGRVSLKHKARALYVENGFSSPTSNNNKKNDFYVTKEDTRVKGPWKDSDPEPGYMQKRIKGINLYPWQETIIETCKKFDDRKIDIIIDWDGNSGKSTLVSYCAYHGIARRIPMIEGCNGKDLMQAAYGIPESQAYFIDLSRASSKSTSSLNGLFQAIESLKDGYIYDMRFEFKEKWIEQPRIFIFVNKIDKNLVNLLSVDRWRFHILEDKELKSVTYSELLRFLRNKENSESSSDSEEEVKPKKVTKPKRVD